MTVAVVARPLRPQVHLGRQALRLCHARGLQPPVAAHREEDQQREEHKDQGELARRGGSGVSRGRAPTRTFSWIDTKESYAAPLVAP